MNFLGRIKRTVIMRVEPITIENALTIVAVLYLPWDDKDFNQLRASFAQYRKPVLALMTIVPDLTHIAKIFAGVINQASEMEQDSDWAVQELYFEAQVEVVQDRPRWLIAHLKDAQGNDDSLDQYNARIKRFS